MNMALLLIVSTGPELHPLPLRFPAEFPQRHCAFGRSRWFPPVFYGIQRIWVNTKHVPEKQPQIQRS